MKKNIIIIIAAVIVAAGIGTGVFFGARSSKTEPTSEAASTVEAATTTTQNIDKTDAVTEETTELTTEATTTKSSSKSSEKLLKADTGDFENLTHILNYAGLTGYSPSREVEDFRYPEYDCTKEDAYGDMLYIFPKSVIEPKLYIYLFGSTTYRKVMEKNANDPLGLIAKRQAEYYEEDAWGYHVLDAENLRIMYEEIFNLDLDTVMNQESIKNITYLHNGSCYSIFIKNGCDDRVTELEYVSDTQKSDGSYEVIFQSRLMNEYLGTDGKIILYGKVKVECSLRDYNGMRLWSIRKVGKA